MAARIEVPYAKEMLTISSTALPLTESIYKTGQLLEATKVVITVADASIRWWSDGSIPVATSSGHLIAATGIIELTDGDIEKFRAIRDTSTDANLAVSYYRSA